MLRSGLALREKSCRVDQDEHGQGLAGSETESCGDGAMVDADSFADSDGNKREGARVQGLAVLRSFATTETSEQFKDDEKKGKTAREWDPRTHE